MDLAAAFKAIGEEKRLAILLAICSHDDICACNLISRFDVSQPTLSRHLSILEKAGLVTTRKEGRWVHYTANRDNLRQLSTALTDLANTDGKNPCC